MERTNILLEVYKYNFLPGKAILEEFMNLTIGNIDQFKLQQQDQVQSSQNSVTESKLSHRVNWVKFRTGPLMFGSRPGHQKWTDLSSDYDQFEDERITQLCGSIFYFPQVTKFSQKGNYVRRVEDISSTVVPSGIHFNSFWKKSRKLLRSSE